MLELIVIPLACIFFMASYSQLNMFFRIKKHILDCGGVIFGPAVTLGENECFYKKFNYDVFIKNLKDIEIFKDLCKNDGFNVNEEGLKINVSSKYNGAQFSVVFYLSEDEFIDKPIYFLHDLLVQDNIGIRFSCHFSRICMDNDIEIEGIEKRAVYSLKNKSLILFIDNKNKYIDVYKTISTMEKRYGWTLSEKNWHTIIND